MFSVQHRRSLQAMPRPVSPTLVAEYAAAFGREDKLKQVGFSYLCDITGRLFQSRKPNLRDMNGNCEAESLENLIWGLVEKLETLSVDPINFLHIHKKEI